MLKWLWLTTLVVILDQTSKQAAVNMLAMHDPHAFLPFFNFTLTYNKGAAFSFLSSAGGWQRWFFTALAIGVSIFIFFLVKEIKWQRKTSCG